MSLPYAFAEYFERHPLETLERVTGVTCGRITPRISADSTFDDTSRPNNRPVKCHRLIVVNEKRSKKRFEEFENCAREMKP